MDPVMTAAILLQVGFVASAIVGLLLWVGPKP